MFVFSRTVLLFNGGCWSSVEITGVKSGLLVFIECCWYLMGNVGV